MARITKFFSIVAAIAILALGTMPARSDAQVSFGLSVSFGPPAIPYYVQPVAPAANLIWQPGYWAYGQDGYYWVPGTWVAAPQPGLYWTPGYWGYNGGQYVWNAGYWGPVVGFYGGINYGYGYWGNGYYGGRWDHDHFYYNTAITRVNYTVVRNYTYVNRTYVRSWRGSVAYNGGPRGIQARPTAFQQRAYSERRFAMTTAQTQHVNYAARTTALRYNVNHGRPAVAAAARPFTSTPRIAARPAYHAPAAAARPAYHAPAAAARPAYHAPAAAARPAYHAPAAAARPAYHAPAAAARPAYHAPAAAARPAYHPAAVARPAYHPAAMSRPMAAPHAAPARPAPARPASHPSGGGGHPGGGGGRRPN